MSDKTDKVERTTTADLPMPEKKTLPLEDVHLRPTPIPGGQVRTAPGRHVLLDLLLQFNALLIEDVVLKEKTRKIMRAILDYLRADGGEIPPELEDF